jgi:hypothetical protein
VVPLPNNIRESIVCFETLVLCEIHLIWSRWK